MIRQATVTDAPTLSGLVEQYWRFEQLTGFDKIRIESLLTAFIANPSSGTAWLAFSNSTPVGYLLAVYVFSLENGGLTAEIDELYVLDSHRGQGIGARLLRAAETFLARDGCKNIALQLGRRNDAGRSFYVRQGYSARSDYELLEKDLCRSEPTR